MRYIRTEAGRLRFGRNLQRQIVHGMADVGRPKTASAAARLQAIDPALGRSMWTVHLDPGMTIRRLINDGTRHFILGLDQDGNAIVQSHTLTN